LVRAGASEGQPCPGDLLTHYPRIELRRIIQRSLFHIWLPAYGETRVEFVKIAGAVFGVPIELMPELHREQAKRTFRRLSWALMAGCFLIALLTGLLYGRNQALNLANRNLADALMQRGLFAGNNKQTYKSLVYVAEAR